MRKQRRRSQTFHREPFAESLFNDIKQNIHKSLSKKRFCLWLSGVNSSKTNVSASGHAMLTLLYNSNLQFSVNFDI